MSVFKRKTSRGETSEYHYKFMQNGKNYYGVCEGCTSEEQAREFEARLKRISKEAAQQRSAVALVENFRQELTGGKTITLAEAFRLAMAKPRKRKLPQDKILRKSNQWEDFRQFMKKNYPEIETLPEVTRSHAEAYIAYIRQNGRFSTHYIYHAYGKRIKRRATQGMAPLSINAYHSLCKEVFQLLQEDAGILFNPFNFPKLEAVTEAREAFTPAEIKLIRDNLDDFTRPLFSVAIATAMREGDICMLRWSDVNFNENFIRRKMRKTGKIVEIPIYPEFRSYLLEQKRGNDSEFIFPKHAALYQRRKNAISYRFKRFLDSLGIQTRRKPEGRTRFVSVKDLHSCRHTFCYYAGLRGIPLVIVQSIVGHMSPEMTKHYMAHSTMEAKREFMALMSDFTGGAADVQTSSYSNSNIREELNTLLDQLSLFSLRRVLDFARGLL